MTLAHPRIWIAGLSLAGVVAFVAKDLTRTAPGPISSVHAREPELQGLGSCAHCHGGWFGDMASSCLECHPAIAAQLDGGNGLHGRLGRERASACGGCHGEHHGAEFALVNRLGFALAGAGDPAQFDHRLIGFEMEGKHLAADCARCHEHADAALLPKGASRFLGLDRNCASCHEDAHDGRMQLGCVQCHGQFDWREHASPDHAEHLPLTGGHAQLDCRRCHENDTPHSLEALGERREPVRARVCADCHESPHRAEFLAGVAALENRPSGAVCTVCHQPEQTGFRDERLTTTPAQHACSGFRLDAPHDAPACADCHAPDAREFAARYPGRSPDACISCHQDVHDGAFAGKPFAANGCIDCHAREQFEPHAFTVEKHARTAFALTGAHAETDCTECHERTHPDQPARFGGTKSRCDDCHEDAHRGYFDRFRRGLAANSAGSCAHCHSTTGFADLPPKGFDHEHWTGFPLDGAHAQSDCESCHERSAEPDAHGRSFGSIRARYGEFRGCVTCHEDPHRGDFDRPELPARVVGRTSCARCHVAASFRAFPDGFDHGMWTGFPLQGAHQRTACTSCHARRAEPDERGRTWQRARGANCDDCHQDPHGGQFDQGGPPDCRSCHRGADSFAELVFRHDLHSRFRLGEQHEKVPCAACHKPFRAGDRDVVRYRPLPVDCVDCHGDAGRPFQRRAGGRR